MPFWDVSFSPAMVARGCEMLDYRNGKVRFSWIPLINTNGYG